MFGFLKKKEKLGHSALTSGEMLPLSACSDAAFATMGQGFILHPKQNELYAPFDCEIGMVFPTKHAIGLRDTEGNEYILHVGVDTVALQGEGFTLFIEEHQKIRCGEKIMEVDFPSIYTKVPSIEVIFINVSGLQCEIKQQNVDAKQNDVVKFYQ
ncbi:MAG: PTS sugar transporter subunit IIA [Erysipelotrichaceae bacterium]